MITYIKKTLSNIQASDWVILAVVIFAFLIRIIFLLYSPLKGWDESVYLNLGRELSKHPLTYSLIHSGWSDYIPSVNTIYQWPNIGFRAPLLPYFLSILYSLKLESLIYIINPLLGSFSVFLVYILGKKLFTKKIGLYSAILFSLAPIHIYLSQQVLTDVFVTFFILITFISFWRGYEEGSKKNKILFGIFLALSLLARYTTLWIIPIFLIYLLIRDKSLKFLNDKYLFYSIGAFFLTLTPWLIYSFKYYNNVLGAFIYGFKASAYWGDTQPWYFFFSNSWKNLSIVGILCIFSILYIVVKKEYRKRGVYLLLIWTIFFLFIAIFMNHKEDRFIMPIIPAICLISGLFIDKFKKFRNIICGLIFTILLISLGYFFKNEYIKSHNDIDRCFYLGNEFLTSDSIEKDSLIVTDQSPIVYFYTGKNNHHYPNPWSINALKNMIDRYYNNKVVYIFFTNFDMDNRIYTKEDLDDNFSKVFECEMGKGYSVVYRYK